MRPVFNWNHSSIDLKFEEAQYFAYDDDDDDDDDESSVDNGKIEETSKRIRNIFDVYGD